MGNVGMFALGALLLLLGTDSLVKGIVAATASPGRGGFVSALGMTVLNALIPAALVCAMAISLGHAGLALGSLVGGAMAQLAFVLGIAAVVAPLVVRLKVFTWINPALLAAVVLVGALAFDRQLGVIDGVVLLAAFAVVAVLVVRAARSERVAARAQFSDALRVVGPALLALRIVLGAAMAGYGAWSLVLGSVGIAAAKMVNPLIVGLIGLGTVTALASLPAAISAARRGHGEFAVGQALLGALCNVLLLAGVLAIAMTPAVEPSLLRFELPALLALALAIYPMMLSDGQLSSREGIVLIIAGVAYVAAELWLSAS